MSDAAFPPPHALLPHAPPMVLLDTIDAIDESSAACRFTIRADMPFVVHGTVPALLAIELVAQTVGVHAGHASELRGEAIRVGYLVSVRDATFRLDGFHVGDELAIRVTLAAGDHALATYTGTVTRGDELAATVSVGVFREDS